jgi:hypothetical protein
MIVIIYKRLLQLAKIAGALTFLFGIPYGIYQFLENKDARRIEQTFDFFKQYNGPPFTTYREKIDEAVSTHKDEIANAAVNEDALAKAISNVIAAGQLETPLALIMDFYDGVAVCVVNDLCDARTTQRLFSRRAREIFTTFYQYIQAQRNGPASSAFGIGLETIAKAK